MRPGHSAARCNDQGDRSDHRPLEGDEKEGRPRQAAAFLPARTTPAGQPSLLGCVASVDTAGHHPKFIKEVVPRGLVARFGGLSSDYLVADFQTSSMAVFFPSWVSQESAIGHSPLRFENFNFSFSNWVEVGEGPRGRLRHKVWIRLHNWPILYWNEEDVKAALCTFGELWEVDNSSTRRSDVSFIRACIRCQDVRAVPETLKLMVEDRRFCIPIEVESWEEARPILLGEELDHHLGLDSLGAQDSFIRQTGFLSVPAAEQRGRPRASGSRSPSGLRLDHRREAGESDSFCLLQNEFPGLPSHPPPAAPRPEPPLSPVLSILGPVQGAGVEPSGTSGPAPVPDVGTTSCLPSGHLVGRPAIVVDKGKKALTLDPCMVAIA